MLAQEYTITDLAQTYTFDPFTSEPEGCPITYSYVLNPPAAINVVAFDEASLTFTFFNDSDISIVMDTPYAILITGSVGTV